MKMPITYDVLSFFYFQKIIQKVFATEAVII